MATNLPAVASPDAEPAFEVKGTVSSLTVLRLRCVDVARIAEGLAARVVPFPQIFQHAPVVVDVGALDGEEVAWAGLVRALRDVKLVPVGVANAAPAAIAAGDDDAEPVLGHRGRGAIAAEQIEQRH